MTTGRINQGAVSDESPTLAGASAEALASRLSIQSDAAAVRPHEADEANGPLEFEMACIGRAARPRSGEREPRSCRAPTTDRHEVSTDRATAALCVQRVRGPLGP